ncbi:thiol reductant ABC exporter subunit CydD [Nocardiopsis sp. RSe5-2]|uniref:Thiol reductant ABC exporter subunit CydD n=1 Tax=Nocardiopsis endophytica TaxID=3018445 RepID=A0ABT4UD30_9ACTN|nr:thiol reductant ABC exporter subunit CydD [Nocardiopsis endophytica]MDA2814900.1 thiol reductant ABC exporter subunit CydD [Nocardiopsis endophytica]
MGAQDDVRRRLARELPQARRLSSAAARLAPVTTAATVAQAGLLAAALAAGFGGGPPERTAGLLLGAGAAVAVRAAAARARAALSERAAAAARTGLRMRLLDHARRLGPVRLQNLRGGDLSTLLTRGTDALGPYYASYLPAAASARTAPAAVLAVLALADWPSALAVALTLPLIPVFGALVGAHTRDRTALQWDLLSRLGGHFADTVAGLPSLRAFGRAAHRSHAVRAMADRYRSATMRVLRTAFLSSLVLELVATLSVALVAVPLGLRLLSGDADLSTALLVLFLAPEAYLPLRALGAAFHDSAEGTAAARRVFAVLDTPVPERGGFTRPPLPEPGDGGPAVLLEGASARYPGTDTPVLDGVDLRIAPGERVALVGATGSGKSTLLALVLGLLTPERGRVAVSGATAWVPQRPHLFAGTVEDNIRLARPDATAEQVRDAARAAEADGFVSRLPDGYATVLGDEGFGLSSGQRRRIALARAFLSDAPVLVLDEPTAHLDPRSEAQVVAAIERLSAGRTVIAATHRSAPLGGMDRVVSPGGAL